VFICTAYNAKEMPDLLKMKTMWEVWGKYIKTVEMIVKKLLFKSNQEVS
jgi:hypothetical protein